MTTWVAFPYPTDYPFDNARVCKLWHKLHAGDREPLPKDPRLLSAWSWFHAGAFQQAADAALELGEPGMSLANKATCMYATFLEPKEKQRQKLFLQVADRASAHCQQAPTNPNAYYWRAYALARYSQCISVAKALALGLGSKVRSDLEMVIGLEPTHADAHVTLGAFHAEVIDKVGALIARMTYGARKETCLRLFELAVQLTPQSASTLMEYARALLILEGDACSEEAARLFERATQCSAVDAQQRLDLDLAQAEMAS